MANDKTAAARERAAPPMALILLLFFVSSALALVYEVAHADARLRLYGT